jgi:hypothetical protein
MGHAFSRPKMRQLCKTLGAVDDAAVAKGEPEFACLVVRQSDRLPGDGWWVSEAERLGYQGLWTGPEAVKFIRRQQKLVFDHWAAPEKRKKSARTNPKKKLNSPPRVRSPRSPGRNRAPRARP